MEYQFPKRYPGREILLASGSPRRRELVGRMGIPFTVRPCDVDESVAPGVTPGDAVQILAARKARAAGEKYGDALILASDTLVALGDEALGKPKDEADARAMLARLSGRTHEVHTGVAVFFHGKLLVEKDTTRVVMRPFDEAEATAYVATGEPMDKAGAYGIQGLGGRLVDHIDGAFDTVMGLPTELVDRLLCAVCAKKSTRLSKTEKTARMAAIVDALKVRYPEATCALEYEGDPWRLLVMGRLSAQCTDARVNVACRDLFAHFPTAEALANADLAAVENDIRPCGLYHVKAQNIIDASKMLVSEFGGVLPDRMEDLLRLPGVGRKVANLLLGDIYHRPAVVTDTHCIRICGRLGMYPEREKDPSKIERILAPLIALAEQSDFCHRIVWFGREVCRARAPLCADCPLREKGLCLHAENEK